MQKMHVIRKYKQSGNGAANAFENYHLAKSKNTDGNNLIASTYDHYNLDLANEMEGKIKQII